MLTILGTILVVLATMGVGVLVDRRWSILPRKERMLAAKPALALSGHAAGEAPATAIEVTAGELEALRRARCLACKGDTDALADDRVIFDGDELLVVHAKCRRCSRPRSTYVRVRQ
jgi:hypothetical protein